MTAVPVKICGLTRSQDVRLCAELGAWAVGFVFAESTRRVDPELAAGLRRELGSAGSGSSRAGFGRRPLAAGVFVDSDVAEVVQIAEAVGLDAVQLHGEESPGSVRELRRRLEGLVIIKAHGIDPRRRDPAAVLDRVTPYADVADIQLLDARVAGRSGGTGTSFSWEAARLAARHTKVLLAGGLTPANAADALRAGGAWGLDVSGGVEEAPGEKSPRALREFFHRVCCFGEGTDR